MHDGQLHGERPLLERIFKHAYQSTHATFKDALRFQVTELGLEDQLLALVVGKERPDLEAQRAELIQV